MMIPSGLRAAKAPGLALPFTPSHTHILVFSKCAMTEKTWWEALQGTKFSFHVVFTVKTHELLWAPTWFRSMTTVVTQIVKNPPASAGDPGPIPGLGRSPGKGNGYPLRYSCLENSVGKGAWWARVHGIKSQTQLRDRHIPSVSPRNNILYE